MISITNQMVKALRLKEVSCSLFDLIYLMSLKMLPAVALFGHDKRRMHPYQNMNMIRHHNETAQPIPCSVEVEQAIGDDLRKAWFPQQALALEKIEFAFKAR